MKENKQQFRIGELAKKLNIERFVIRFWEKEFGLSAPRSDGGQRYYVQKDFERLQHIKMLLYEKGLTIAGAKKALHQNSTPYVLETKKETQPTVLAHAPIAGSPLHVQLQHLKERLIKLKEIL